MVATKKHVLLVISNEPIEPPKNLEGVQHLICTEVELKHESSQGIDFVTDQTFENTQSHGQGNCVSAAITNWLFNLVSGWGYVPFYKKTPTS